MDRRMFKKSKDELTEYLMFQRRGSIVKARKGKSSYTRKTKHKKRGVVSNEW